VRKAVAVCMVKNESDVIESYIRHNSKYVDSFVIIDNGSKDGTNEILKSLATEGFDITNYDESQSAYDQELLMNKYIDIIISDYNPEFIFPLDSDEFIETKMSGRVFIDSLPDDKFSLLKWRTYIPTPSDNGAELFIPKRISHSRKACLEKFEKVIIPTKLFQMKRGRLTAGNHSIYNVDENDFYRLTTSNVAHFPIRCEQQVVSKVTVGYINIMSSTNWSGEGGYHWKNILDNIKNKKNIDLKSISLNYALNTPLTQESFDEHIEMLGFFENSEIQLQYGALVDCNPFLNLLYNAEAMAHRLSTSLNDLDYYNRSAVHRIVKYINKYYKY
jgi:hypothetical protein